MWAQDFLAAHPATKQIINDSWTPSGPMHIGTFRSMVIHDVLRRVLTEEEKEATYFYGYDDYDPMDGIPPGFAGFEEHLGKPLINVPARSKKFANFADEFIADSEKYQEVLGVRAQHYRTSELYRSGKFNPAIERVLDHAAGIRKIYLEVSGSKRPEDWYPVQVVCPNCGKLGSTYVNSWDGKEVTFQCRKDLVPWAKGCGYVGKISPFDGRAKMHWRVEWTAKWDLFDVTIEAAGKDHANRGGSFDTGARILKEVFGKKPIAAFPHELFLLNGKKMGSTKERIDPETALAVFTPETLRFLLVRTRPMQAIEIDLSRVVPQTYDEYDRCQSSYLEKTDQDLADFFYYSQIDPAKVDGLVKTRFSNVVNILQLPSLRAELTRPETAPRVPYAKTWLEKYAPAEVRFTVTEKLPPEAKTLTSEQKKYLAAAAKVIDTTDPVELQTKLYELSKQLNLSAGTAFEAIYIALIGKTSGPRAGELLATLPAEVVRHRFLEAAK